MLTPDEKRSLTDAVYQERKEGQLTFEVKADVSVESEEGLIRLKKVGLTKYDEKGNPTNLVFGEAADYDVGQKQIRFAGDVRLRLADGTDIYSESVSADLQREVVDIADAFRFERGDVSGRGQSLQYRIAPRHLSIHGPFHLSLPLEESKVSVEAHEAFYDLPAHKVDLAEAARIEGAGNRLGADRISIQMTELNRVDTVVGVGSAHLDVGADRFFRGEEIRMSFDPVLAKLIGVVVSGQPDPSEGRAVYQEQTPGGRHYLEASRITVLPVVETEAKNVRLQGFTADGEVAFLSGPLAITEAKAERLVGAFSQENELRTVDLRENVLLVRNVPAPGQEEPGEERLRSRELHLRFGPGQVLEEAVANGQVAVETRRQPEGRRRLTARDSVHFFYKDGQPEHIESKGDSLLEETVPNGWRRAAAPSMVARYRNGQIEHVTAKGGVVVTTEEGGVTRTSSSQELEGSYVKGLLKRILQQGDVRHRDAQKGTILEMRAGVSEYDTEREVLALTGVESPVLRYITVQAQDRKETQTTARRIELDRKADSIRAEGAVRTLLGQGEDLITVHSGRLEAERRSGWAVYSDSPRIIRRDGAISGQVIRYHADSQRLVVDRDVVTTMTDRGGKKFRVGAQHLVYDRASQRARYEGSVQVTSVDFSLKAPFVEIVFGEQKQDQVSEVVAWGGVEVVQNARKAKGDRAVYFPSTQKLLMTG